MPNSGSSSRPPASIDRLLDEHLPGLTAFVRLRAGPLLRAHESCSDIVQSACREVLDHAGRFRFGGSEGFRHWLYTTALRKIVDRKRYYSAAKRNANALRPPSESASEQQIAACYRAAFTTPSQAAMKREDVERLERAFDELSEQDREVVTLARIVGLSHAEIARRTGSTPGAVRVRLSRAIARLARLMSEPKQRRGRTPESS
jgi:RNA polymerase sigma-70 factor (ECF subfamily)